ncbi:hypothetical protein BHE74_00037295 [Ensete ventricosum]|nr:hypothetical protein BHE74_00037295 [Ensete ventricosum]
MDPVSPDTVLSDRYHPVKGSPHTIILSDRCVPLVSSATNLFKMLLKYRPEDRAAKKERLLKRAQAEAEGKTVEVKKPIVVKYGLNHVTYLIEQIVHKKTASVLCLTTVKNEDKLEFSKILEAIKANFNDKFDEIRKKWGGGIMVEMVQRLTYRKRHSYATKSNQTRVVKTPGNDPISPSLFFRSGF